MLYAQTKAEHLRHSPSHPPYYQTESKKVTNYNLGKLVGRFRMRGFLKIS